MSRSMTDLDNLLHFVLFFPLLPEQDGMLSEPLHRILPAI